LEQASINFEISSSLLNIYLENSDSYTKLLISDNLRSYLQISPLDSDNQNEIVILINDITQLGQIVKNIIDILDSYGLRAKVDANIENALIIANKAETDFYTFSEEARRIRNGENVLAEIPEFIETIKSKLTRKPFKKQLLASFHITFAKNVANFSVPGTGKTTMVYTAFAAMNADQVSSSALKSLLVVGPLSCFVPWLEEFEQCFGRKSNHLIIESISDLDFLHLSNTPYELILINYEKMRHGSLFVNRLLSYCRIYSTMLVLDEAHRVKNPDGVYAQSIMPLSRYAVSRVVLTGTPIPQGFQDLLNIARFLYPDKRLLPYSFGRLKQFTKNPRKYAREIQHLTADFEPYFIRLSKSDFKIKEAVDNDAVIVPFSETERRIWNTVDAICRDSKSKFSIIRLLQASSNPFLLAEKLNIDEFYGNEDIESASNQEINVERDDFVNQKILQEVIEREGNKLGTKIQACASLVSDMLNDGEKVIVWVIFTDTALRLNKALKNLNIVSGALLGKSNSVAAQINNNLSRDEIIDKFKNTLELNCVIANAAAVGESISLHKNLRGEKVCCNAIYLERNFNCAQYLQSRDRIHRVGIADDVIVNYHFLNTPGTLDEHLDNSLKKKSKMMEEFIENEPIPLLLLEDTDVMKEVYDSYYGAS